MNPGVVCIQARLGGTRFPGKVLRDIGTQTVLAHVVDRAVKADVGDVFVLAPSRVQAQEMAWYVPDGGHTFGWDGVGEDDLLARFTHVVETFDYFRWVVRLTADNPLVPVECIRAVADTIREDGGPDYVETRSDPSTRPNGIDVQGFTVDVLRTANKLAQTAHFREHMTPALLAAADNPVQLDKVGDIQLDDLPPWRLTLDTRADLEWLRTLHVHVGDIGTVGLKGLLYLADTAPHIFRGRV